MYTIYKKFEFASAHQIKGHPKCGKLHGHNYIVEAWVSSLRLSGPYDFVLDFAYFKEIADKYDHTGEILTISSEILARNIVENLHSQGLFENVKVKIWESDHSYAEFEITRGH